MISLSVKNRKTGASQKYKFNQSKIILGRGADCDVVLDSPTASRKHAKISVQNQSIQIEDLKSGNGTFVGGERIETAKPISLKKEHDIRIEDYEIHFETDTDFPKETSLVEPVEISLTNNFEKTDPDILEMKMIKKILGSLDHEKDPTIVFITDPVQNKKFTLKEEKDFVIGRDPDCDISIDSAVVSRKHAKISHKWGGFTITDLGSKNGIVLNGEKIDQEKAIKDGDEICFGTLKAFFKNPSEFSLNDVKETLEQKNFDKTDNHITIPSADKNQQDRKPSESAKTSLTPNEDDFSDEEINPAKKKNNHEDVGSELDFDDPKDSQSVKIQNQKNPLAPFLQLIGSLSIFEKILLGFGVFVLFLILIFIVMLMQ